MRLTVLLLLLVFLGHAAAPVADPEALLREGNTAFRRGDYAAAAECYERAGLRTTEPELIAFNLAAAKYRGALDSAEGRARDLDEAEQCFRCCLRATDPRRGRALQFLGACLLQEAIDRDGSKAKEAVARLEECLSEPGLDAESADDARHNLALARLVLVQNPPSESPRSPDKPPDDEAPPNKPQARARRPAGDRPTNPGGERSPGHPDRRTKTTDTKTEASRTGADNRDARAGGQNTERGPDGQGTDPADVRHLTDAYDRIMDEQQAHKRKKAPPAAPGVKDW